MDATRGATVGSAGAQPAPAPAPARPSTCPPTWSGVRCGDRRRVDYPFNCIGAACVERGGASGCTWHDVGTLAQPYVDAQCRTPRQQWQHMCAACDDEPINAWRQQAEAERAAEKIDSEAQFHKLERSYTSLRTERDELAATNAALARQTHRQHAQPVVSNGQEGQARTRHAGGRPGLPCVSTDKRKLECAKGRDCGIRVSEVGREKNV